MRCCTHMLRSCNEPRNNTHFSLMDSAEEEPLFNYSRFVKWKNVSDAEITCATLHNKFLAVGSNNGTIHIFELLGKGKEWRRIHAHHCRINDICTDEFGEYIGSAAEDGSVVASAVLSEEKTQHSHHKAVKCVRLAPDFSRQRDKPLVTGGINGRLHLLKRGWLFGSMTEKLIHEGEGPVRAISWCGSLLAWANDVGVKVYDYEKDARICFVEAPQSHPSLDLCAPRLYWESEDTLIVGWGFDLRVLAISPRPAAAIRAVTSPAEDSAHRRTGEITHKHHMNAAICGVAPFGEDIAVLCFHTTLAPQSTTTSDEMEISIKLKSAPATTNHITLRIICRTTGEELFCEEIPLDGTSRYNSPNDFKLIVDHDGTVGNEGMPLLFMLSPQDIVCAQPRGVLDHIEWESRNKRFEQALGIALANRELVHPSRIRALVDNLLEEVVRRGDSQHAAKICISLLHDDSVACSFWIKKVIDEAEVDFCSAFTEAVFNGLLVSRPNPAAACVKHLPADTYTYALQYALVNDPVLFLRLLRVVNAAAAATTATSDAVYDAVKLLDKCRSLHSRATRGEKDALSSCLIELLIIVGKIPEALEIFVESQTHSRSDSKSRSPIPSNRIFQLIEQHNVHREIAHYLEQLTDIDMKSTAQMIANHFSDFDLHALSAAVRHKPAQLLEVLDALVDGNVTAYNTAQFRDIHEFQLVLYSKYAPLRLLHFLEWSSVYRIDVALDVCRATTPPMHRELVYLFARMGSAREAINIALDLLDDLVLAIDVAKKFEDDELWAELLTKCLSTLDGTKISRLLQNALSSKLNIIKVVDMLPEGVDIPGLHQFLEESLQDRRVDTAMIATCADIARKHVIDMIYKMSSAQKAPVPVLPHASCVLCRNALHQHPSFAADSDEPTRSADDRVTVFFCRHVYHEVCLTEYHTQTTKRARSKSSSLADSNRARGTSFSSHSLSTPTHGFSVRDTSLHFRTASSMRRSSSGSLNHMDSAGASATDGQDMARTLCPMCAGAAASEKL